MNGLRSEFVRLAPIDQQIIASARSLPGPVRKSHGHFELRLDVAAVHFLRIQCKHAQVQVTK